ncbi:hypothetical protein ABZU25_25030 [Micromonospora sp. NPDC005215]|uniref:hypothetical protein n=1 Tax=Micromonospora sp. NPDC005215 TaxID=3157024 RepID=UPI0033A05879
MGVRAEHDRAALARLLGRDPVLHVYQLGDLVRLCERVGFARVADYDEWTLTASAAAAG